MTLTKTKRAPIDRTHVATTVTLPFTLDVLPTQFVLNSGVPTFNAVNGAPIAPQTVTFALNNDVFRVLFTESPELKPVK